MLGDVAANMQNSVEQPLSVMLKDRRAQLLPLFSQYRLDALLIESGPNLRYLTGFSGSKGALVLTPEEGWFICDSRYTVQAADEVPGLVLLERNQSDEALAELQAAKGWQRLGFESVFTSFSVYRKLQERLSPLELIPLENGLDSLRIRKDRYELAALEQVAQLASKALLACLPKLRPGMRETDFALMLEYEMRLNGAEGRAFDFIVASGERGAMPHGRASEKMLVDGELVTIDFGALCNGYHSDETVTVALGSCDERQRDVYEIVRTAHDRAIAAVRPGMTCKALDAVAREYIAACGYADYFGHGLGHGVGLEIHEKPTVSFRSEVVLEEGMVLTIEPGIYIPGWGGVRIEDTVAVTADGCRVLTAVPKQLLTV